jgi:hypothetical protein
MKVIIKEPGDKVLMIEMTDERIKRLKAIGLEVVELCEKECTPVEAYMVLEVCLRGLEEQYGFKSSTMIPNEELGRLQ